MCKNTDFRFIKRLLGYLPSIKNTGNVLFSGVVNNSKETLFKGFLF